MGRAGSGFSAAGIRQRVAALDSRLFRGEQALAPVCFVRMIIGINEL